MYRTNWGISHGLSSKLFQLRCICRLAIDDTLCFLVDKKYVIRLEVVVRELRTFLSGFSIHFHKMNVNLVLAESLTITKLF